jgi:hypothetical protein
MGRLALHRLAAFWQTPVHELSKLAWLTIFGVARRSFGLWIDGLD